MDRLEKEISDSVKNMNFGDAIQALKAGEKVARAGWNGKGMWLSYVPRGQYWLEDDYGLDANGNPICSLDLLAWIGIKTADDKFVPWLASQTDMLAEDWQILD